MKPITSRIKRSPLFSYGESPMKQVATTGGTIEGDDKEITETKKRLSYDEAWEQNVEGIKDKYKDKASYIADREKKRKDNPTAFEKDLETKTGVSGGPGTVETKKKVKGDDIDYEETLYTTKEDKVVQGPANTRKQERAGVFTDRKLNKYRRKLGKYGTFDDKGKFTARKDLSQRDIRKMLQAQSGYDRNKSASANVQSGVDSGTGLGGKYYGGQRVMDKGELPEPKQKKIAEREHKRRVKRQSDAAVEVGAVNPFASFGNINTGLNLYTPTTNYMDLLKTAPTKMKKGYTQKAKSPATKALKGAQNTLPQHLQDAIKAAPGKMKAPLKKGYFK